MHLCGTLWLADAPIHPASTEMQKRFQEEGYRSPSQRLWEYLIEQECCHRTFNNEFLSAWWREMVWTPLFSTLWYVHMVISEVGLIPPSTEEIRGWGFHSKGWTMEIGHFYQSLKKDLWTISSVVELMDGRQFGADQMVSIVASLL